ncbi:uncharacterized protein LOC135384019 [Ornithodoros turicata]|uniref:uncharacterized protein LOC135384019 n=1 Tax=Ornithodoros turicata TaxID=34597 RepID=UPI003138B5F8
MAPAARSSQTFCTLRYLVLSISLLVSYASVEESEGDSRDDDSFEDMVIRWNISPDTLQRLRARREANVRPFVPRRGNQIQGDDAVALQPYSNYRDVWIYGKKDAHFNPWGGKRDGAHTLSGLDDSSGLWSEKKDNFNPWGGKKEASFNPWGGKRDNFNPWGGKRDNFNPWGGKKDNFNPWGGKKDSSIFNPWGGKRGDGSKDKELSFNPWGGKRQDGLGTIFGPWGGKRENLFNPWGGKRGKSEMTFNPWGGKKSELAFSPWKSASARIKRDSTVNTDTFIQRHQESSPRPL